MDSAAASHVLSCGSLTLFFHSFSSFVGAARMLIAGGQKFAVSARRASAELLLRGGSPNQTRSDCVVPRVVRMTKTSRHVRGRNQLHAFPPAHLPNNKKTFQVIDNRTPAHFARRSLVICSVYHSTTSSSLLALCGSFAGVYFSVVMLEHCSLTYTVPTTEGRGRTRSVFTICAFLFTLQEGESFRKPRRQLL